LSKVRSIALGIFGVLAGFLTIPADAQNLDAGKSPAQIFADTCSACHRRAQELKKPSASFLRSHYTTSQAEAASLAGYLAGIPGDPRGSQQRKQSGSATPSETRPTRRQEQSPKEQSREQPRSTQGPAENRGRRSRNVEDREKGAAPAPAAPVTTATPAPATAPAVQAPPAEPPPQATAAPAPPARPPLDPFEE
jgi:hypothetical protein